MLVAAALVPDTALLVPGAAGAADVLAGLREAALAAVAEVVRSRPQTVVVVAPGARDRMLTGTVRLSLAAAGIPDDLLRWPAVEITVHDRGPWVGEPSVPSVVALQLLGRADRSDGLRVAEVTRARGLGALTALGRELVAEGPTALVVVGSLSGRHGPDAPLADDPRSARVDARLLADLAEPGPQARARLAAADPATADELAVRGWAPWQVLLGAVGDRPVEARLLADDVAFGAQHAVLVWTPA
jgi:hypothetical protein